MSTTWKNRELLHVSQFLGDMQQRFKPHQKQKEVLASHFVHGGRRIFLEAGRKFGKTDTALYFLTRHANTNFGHQCYYFAALAKGVREIVWKSRRLEHMVPRKYVATRNGRLRINDTEMRIHYTSESFIKCDGADEFRFAKGFEPHAIVLDEFADYPRGFYEAMSPNFIPNDCIVMIISSPPWELESSPGESVMFVKIADAWRMLMEREKDKRRRHFYFHGTCYDNPHLTKENLDAEREMLIEMGEGDLWEREYLAKRVQGGGKRLVATFDEKIHKVSHEWLLATKIEKDIDSLDWVTSADPGSSTVFATIIMAVNQYNKEVYFLDEVYKTNALECDTGTVMPEILDKEDLLYPKEIREANPIRRVYDEAAKWFALESLKNFNVSWNPSDKINSSEEFGLSLLRMIFGWNIGYVSDRCRWLTHELLNYRINDKRRPAGPHHLIDAVRYALSSLNYYLRPEDKQELPKQSIGQRRRELLRANHLTQEKIIGPAALMVGIDVEDNIGYGYH